MSSFARLSVITSMDSRVIYKTRNVAPFEVDPLLIEQMKYAINEAVHFLENAQRHGALKHEVDYQKANYVLGILNRASSAADDWRI